MGAWETVGYALWFILPAYVANASPVAFGGGRPIDGNRKFLDGRPLFGPGKTIRGFLAGLAAGIVTGLVLYLLHPFILETAEPVPGLGSLPSYLRLSSLLSLGALTGDLLGSFVKRRLGMARGDPAFLLDQLGFLVLALLFAYPFFRPSRPMVIFLLLITPALHLGTNVLAFKLRMKERPY
ncbi:MAG: CDP-2,3-bis-(O-geranylgeranyl)-sn-glycerol synthase [Candidatus Hadarchaeales archaeon]